MQHSDLGLGHDGPSVSHSPNPVHDRVRSHAMTVVRHRHTGGTGSHGLSPSRDRGHGRGLVLCPVHGRDRGHGHGHNLCPGPVRGRGGHGPCPCPSLYLCHVGPCRALCPSHGD